MRGGRVQEQGSVLREQFVALALLGLMVVGTFSLLTTGLLATQMAHRLSPRGGPFVCVRIGFPDESAQCCYGGFRVRQARKPLSLDTLDVVGHRLGFLALSAGIRLGLLVGQVTRMHDHQPECLQGDSSVAVLDLDLAHHTLSMPVARRFVLRPPGLLYQEGQSGLLAPPDFKRLPDGTRARD
jgi:hypothetical protein